MRKTTIYLRDEAKDALEQIARHEHAKEAELIREAIDRLIADRKRPKPTIPLFRSGLPSIASDPRSAIDGLGE